MMSKLDLLLPVISSRIAVACLDLSLPGAAAGSAAGYYYSDGPNVVREKHES